MDLIERLFMEAFEEVDEFRVATDVDESDSPYMTTQQALEQMLARYRRSLWLSSVHELTATVD